MARRFLTSDDTAPPPATDGTPPAPHMQWNLHGSAAKAAVAALAVAWRPVLWAAVLADVGTCLLVILHSMTVLREPGTTARRGGGKEDGACRATARSLAMRSQLAGAPNTATAGGQTNGCRCCQKPASRPFEQAHSVVIDIPAASSAAL